MTMLVVVGFVVCWTPYFVVSLVRIYSDYQIQLSEALSISEIMALGHSAVNPLLYMIYSRRAIRLFCWQVRRRVRCRSCRWAARRAPQCPSPPLQPQPLPSDVHVTGNGRNDADKRDRTRRRWFIAGDGEGVGVTHTVRSAPCHATCSWSSTSRRPASAATDGGTYRRRARLLTDDNLPEHFPGGHLTTRASAHN